MTKTPFSVNYDARPQSSRRALLCSLAITPVALAAGVTAGARSSQPIEQDPVFAAIAAHQAARDHLNTMDREDGRWDSALKHECSHWHMLVETTPATLVGAAAFADYVMAYPDLAQYAADEGLLKAFSSIRNAMVALTGGAHV